MRWRPILGSKTNKEIHELIIQVASEIEKESIKREVGLMNGICGEIVFFSYLNKYTKTNKYTDQISKRYEIIVDEIGSINRLPGTICYGTVGVIWALDHLIKNNFIKADISFDSFYDYFSEYISFYSKEKEYDFLHGSLGTVLGLLDVYKENQNASVLLHSFFKKLEDDAIQTKQTAKWTTTITVDREDEDVYNLSLAHGISSTIIILCELIKKKPDHKGMSVLLQKSCNFLLESKLKGVNVNSIFPPWVSQNNQKREESRLGWCYGDLGCAIALFKAGKILQNKKYLAESLDILKHSIKRKTLEETHVLDASFCHGTSGIAHIYNRFFHETQLNEFKNASIYWYEQTLQIASKNGDHIFKYFNRPSSTYEKNHSLLQGTVGIGLSLISANSYVLPKWDRCLLLS